MASMNKVEIISFVSTLSISAIFCYLIILPLFKNGAEYYLAFGGAQAYFAYALLSLFLACGMAVAKMIRCAWLALIFYVILAPLSLLLIMIFFFVPNSGGVIICFSSLFILIVPMLCIAYIAGVVPPKKP